MRFHFFWQIFHKLSVVSFLWISFQCEDSRGVCVSYLLCWLWMSIFGIVFYRTDFVCFLLAALRFLEIFHANWTRSAHSAAAVFVPTQIATIFNCQKLQRKFSKSILDSVSIFRCKAIIKYINFCWFECFPSNFVRFYCIFPACGAKLCHIPGTHLKFNICVFPGICKVV